MQLSHAPRRARDGGAAHVARRESSSSNVGKSTQRCAVTGGPADPPNAAGKATFIESTIVVGIRMVTPRSLVVS
jgi:hypothetical protein